MNKFYFYKEVYYKEIERRNNIYNLLNIPLTIVTALIGLNAYVITNFKNLFNSNIGYVACLMLASFFILLIVFSNYFIKVYQYTDLYSFPKGDFIQNEIDDIKKHNKKISNKKINKNLEIRMCSLICSMNEVLTKDNNKKTEFTSQMQKALVGIIMMTGLNLFTFLIYGR